MPSNRSCSCSNQDSINRIEDKETKCSTWSQEFQDKDKWEINNISISRDQIWCRTNHLYHNLKWCHNLLLLACLPLKWWCKVDWTHCKHNIWVKQWELCMLSCQRTPTTRLKLEKQYTSLLRRLLEKTRHQRLLAC